MERQTKGAQNKKEGPWHERLFQLFLVVFGFSLGVTGTCVWEGRSETRHRESLVRVIKANVQHEMRLAKSLREYLTAKEDVERLAPGGFDCLHDPSLYSSLQGSFGQLDDRLLVDLLSFYRTMESCVNMRNLFQEGLAWCWENKGKPLPEGYLENYVTVLELVEDKGKRVLSTIESVHPNIKLDARLPSVAEHDFSGYVPQQEYRLQSDNESGN